VLETAVLAVPPMFKLEEALRVPASLVTPVTLKSPPTEEEALAIYPLWRVARLVVRKVEETVVAPETESVPPMDDEALEM